MVAWVFFNWWVGQYPTSLYYCCSSDPSGAAGKCISHLNAQTCTKALEILNERTQLPAPWWHSVLTDPDPALLMCQGAAGVGCSLWALGSMLPPARAQPTAPAHGEWGRDGSRDWGQPWPSSHPHTALFPGAAPRLAPSQSWLGPLAARLLSGERRLQSKLGFLGPKVCGYFQMMRSQNVSNED